MGRLTRIQTTLESNRHAISITDPHVIIQYIVFKDGSTSNIQPKDQPNDHDRPHQHLLSLVHPFTTFSYPPPRRPQDKTVLRKVSFLTLFHYVRPNRFVFGKSDVQMPAPTPAILTRQSLYSSISPDSRANVRNMPPPLNSSPLLQTLVTCKLLRLDMKPVASNVETVFCFSWVCGVPAVGLFRPCAILQYQNILNTFLHTLAATGQVCFNNKLMSYTDPK